MSQALSEKEVLPWFHPIWQQLTHYKKDQHLHSSILLHGPAGIGKQQLAMKYAKYILCAHTNDTGCDQCRSCVLFNAGNHPDFFTLQPEEKSHHIKIEQVRDLINTLSHTAVLQGYQVALIRLAENLNKASANALLKTLEEPRGNVVILLISDQPSLIPATIRSRCFSMKLSVPKQQEATDWLTQQLNSKPEALTYLSLADGLPYRALKLAKENQYQAMITLGQHLVAVKNGTLDPIEAAQCCLSKPEQQLHLLIFFVCDLIRLKLSGTGSSLADGKILTMLGAETTVTLLFQFLDSLLEAKQLLASHSNVNLQLLMEQLFIKWRYNYAFG